MSLLLSGWGNGSDSHLFRFSAAGLRRRNLVLVFKAGSARRYGSDNEAKIHGFGFGAQLIFSNRLEKPGELL